ncbi:LRR receptor-like serine/threonine-protein kinase GSO2 isoform X1 [Capsicum galapagoense]
MPTFATGKCLKGNQLEPDPQLQKSFELGCSSGCWDLSFNELSGGVPKSISTSLTYIEVNDNKLSGHIPHQLGKLIQLQYLSSAPINRKHHWLLEQKLLHFVDAFHHYVMDRSLWPYSTHWWLQV